MVVLGRSRVGQPNDGFKTSWRARPMAAEGCLADQADDTAQGDENDDDVIGVTQNGHKIGDEINRKGEVGKQEAEPDTDPARLRTVPVSYTHLTLPTILRV